MEKFFFNNNIFDDSEGLPAPDDEDITSEAEEELIPLPPMFTEEELEKARQQAFEKGRQDGINQTKEEREEQSTQLLDKLTRLLEEKTSHDLKKTNNISTQALKLALAMFEKTLPILQSKYGLEDLKTHIEDILQASAHETAIIIYVHPDMVDPFGPYIAELKKRNAELQCDIKGDERLSLYGCNITWENGGGQIDQVAIADKVMHTVKQVLAGAELKGNDNIDDKVSADNYDTMNEHTDDEIVVPESEDGETHE